MHPLYARSIGSGSLKASVTRFSLASAGAVLFSLGHNNLAFGAPSDSLDANLAAGEPRSDTQANLNVDAIIEKALTAYGGTPSLKALIENSQWTGDIKFGQAADKPFAYKQVRKGNLWRTEVEAGAEGEKEARVKITAFDGGSVWQASANEAKYLPADQGKMMVLDDERQPGLLLNFDKPEYKFALAGEKEFHGVPTWAIEVSKGGQLPTTIYLDKNNYLIVGMTFQVPAENSGQSKGEKVFLENRPVSGSIFPFSQTETIDGEKIYEVKLATMRGADEISPDFFLKPGPKKELRLSKVVAIPFDYGQHEIICKGRVDNSSDDLYFLFDTGASETIIDRRIAAQLLLTRGQDFRISAYGGDVSTQTTVVKRLELGNLIINDINAKVVDLSNQSRQLGKTIAGIIGMNVISGYLVTIDYGKPEITFADASSPRPNMDGAINFAQANAPTVKVSLGGNDTQEFLMDTGAAFNHINNGVARRHLPKDATTAKHLMEGTGLDGKPVQLATITIDPVVIGNQQVRRATFTYPIDANQDPHKGSQPIHSSRFGGELGQNIGILGNPFWQNFVVTIDGRYQKILLKPNPGVALKIEIEQAIDYGDSELVTKRQLRNAEMAYEKALMVAESARDVRYQAIVQGRLGNLRRIMAHDLKRTEHAGAAYKYFVKADELARRIDAKDVDGRILADWSLLYSDNGQMQEAKLTIDKAIQLAPQDPNVNVDCAVHLFRAGQYPDVQRCIDKALFLDPSNWQALWYQVKLCERFNDVNREKDVLKDIVKYYPWSKVARDKLSAVGQTLQQLQAPKPAQ
jgi:predicted aspartyl protease/Flp pilus assembly protein TadD